MAAMVGGATAGAAAVGTVAEAMMEARQVAVPVEAEVATTAVADLPTRSSSRHMTCTNSCSSHHSRCIQSLPTNQTDTASSSECNRHSARCTCLSASTMAGQVPLCWALLSANGPSVRRCRCSSHATHSRRSRWQCHKCRQGRRLCRTSRAPCLRSHVCAAPGYRCRSGTSWRLSAGKCVHHP